MIELTFGYPTPNNNGGIAIITETIEITKDNLSEMMEIHGAHLIAHGLLDKLLNQQTS